MKLNTRITAGRLGLVMATILAAYLLSHIFRVPAVSEMDRSDMMAASNTMISAMNVIQRVRIAMGLPIDVRLDPNSTGLIGVESSEITTTIGDPVSKRSSVNPDFAALTLRWFRELGLKEGDRIALSASGSFPGIFLAVLSACKTAGLQPVIMLSLGASEFGANIPGLSIVELLDILNREGVFEWKPHAISLGGDGDSGKSEFLTYDSRPRLEMIAGSTGYPVLSSAASIGIDKAVKERMGIYTKKGYPRLFVNIGGAEVAYGSRSASLKLPNGLIHTLPSSLRALAPDRKNGLIFEFLELGIPVIHFLDIKNLALAKGIPIDPVPLPKPGESALYKTEQPSRIPALIGIFVALLLLSPWANRLS
jgi:poly-gamma-glutamate system protein